MAKQTYPTIFDQNEIKLMEQRVTKYREEMAKLSPELQDQFLASLDITWCYHDFAIEGIVLNHLEIKSALDDRIISDSSLIPHYDEVQCFYKGIKKVRLDGSKKRLNISVNYIKELYSLINLPSSGKSSSYRKEIPLHRQYAHDFSPPEKIPYRMRKFGEWLDSPKFKKLPVLLKAAELHNRLMAIFPWSNKSGVVIRLVMNLVFIHSGYPIALIPDVERQTYYENILTDLTHDSNIRMVKFLNENFHNYLNSVSKKLGLNF